uniref:Uncharacterized protein n=1 Tax=Anguilla anguilla TaxID=7936 RepID=A0A0E9SW35_ANGAN
MFVYSALNLPVDIRARVDSPFKLSHKMEMVPSEEKAAVPKEIENAADEPRVLCIVQDTTNAKTVTERLTLNLPASTPLAQLFQGVAHKAGYVVGSFHLAWANMAEPVSFHLPLVVAFLNGI